MNRWLIKSMVAVLLSGAGPASAHAAEGTTDALLACSKETDDASRLRCFDSVVAGLRRAPAPAATAAAATATAATGAVRPSAPPAASPPVVAPTASPQDKFGARGDLNPERHHALDEIEGTVTEVGRRAYGELVVTLDNGQVWAEKTANSKIKVKVGDAVTIEAGVLGSFNLVANGRSSKVTRVR